MKEFTCIACPVGCSLRVEANGDKITVTGNQCKRGQIFGTNEYSHPMRMVTTTLRTVGCSINRVPVISTGEVPKAQLRSIVKELYKVSVPCPIKRGDIIVENIQDTGVNIIATRSITKNKENKNG
jgi:CxxC motif-containing protein